MHDPGSGPQRPAQEGGVQLQVQSAEQLRQSSPVSQMPSPHLGIGVVALALQEAGVPPPLPEQVQVQGPVPLTAVAVPALQRLVVGAEAKVPPLAVPQTPGPVTVYGIPRLTLL